MSDLTDTELDRYARQLILKELGGAGQLRLKAARIALVGIGGLGCPASLYLAAAGVGALTLIDDDDVSLDNLHRQILFTDADIGRPKVMVAAERLTALNPHVTIHPVQVLLTPNNALDILADHDLILDGSDSFSTRLVVNIAAVSLAIPLVSGAIGAFDGQVGLFEGHRADAPCYQCFTGPATDRPGMSCADQGVIGPTAGIIGSLMAQEALRCITGFGSSQRGQLLLHDGLSGRMRRVAMGKDPACEICGLPDAAICR